MQFYDSTPEHDLTYSDVFLIPGRSSVGSRLNVSLAPSDGTGMSIPIVSSNMNSVTGPRLAATLARRGGLGVLPQDLHLQDLDTAIRWVKDQPVAFDTPIVLGPEQTVSAALRLVPVVAGHGIVVRDADGDVLGCISAHSLGGALPDARLGDLVHERTASIDADDVDEPRAAFDLMVAADLEFAPVLRRGVLVGTLSGAVAHGVGSSTSFTASPCACVH